jgi:hypothetical protein
VFVRTFKPTGMGRYEKLTPVSVSFYWENPADAASFAIGRCLDSEIGAQRSRIDYSNVALVSRLQE